MMLNIKGHLLSMDTICQASNRVKALERLESVDFRLWMSIQKKHNIATLTKSLIPPGVMEITLAHWARIAFLRASLVEFCRIVASQSFSQDTTAAEQQEAGGHNSTTDQSKHQLMTPNSEQDAEETCTPHLIKAVADDVRGRSPCDQLHCLLEEFWEFAKMGTTEEWEDNVKDFFTESLQVDMAIYAEPGRLVPPVNSYQNLGWNSELQMP
ncbi:hypothetical protein SERLA73DRAFT_150188 [Serpula lacrymans var. lacrymans S7.3]|uniref:Uncharacterized protein n=1 Tax=Serpula lacrymans var. lacrymans (strain S7.3) TaxID=936435 RepID=F8PLE7_SERL3|nr:hypothetical protein SERLA73DRAFT_150188 [Serpula lacrymans var. lacrymans S7.3]